MCKPVVEGRAGRRGSWGKEREAADIRLSSEEAAITEFIVGPAFPSWQTSRPGLCFDSNYRKLASKRAEIYFLIYFVLYDSIMIPLHKCSGLWDKSPDFPLVLMEKFALICKRFEHFCRMNYVLTQGFMYQPRFIRDSNILVFQYPEGTQDPSSLMDTEKQSHLIYIRDF